MTASSPIDGPFPRPRPTRPPPLYTDDLAKIDFQLLRRRGMLRPGTEGLVFMQGSPERPLSVGYAIVTAVADGGRLQLVIKHAMTAVPGSESETVVDVVQRSAKQRHVRALACPVCRHPRLHLYLLPGKLACAGCLRLRRPLRTPAEMARGGLARLHRQMTTDEDLMELHLEVLPLRRKGGWWRVYKRRLAKHQRLVRRMLGPDPRQKLIDALTGPLSERALISKMPRAQRLALLRKLRGGPTHRRLPPWRRPQHLE